MERGGPERLWVVRHGQSAGNLARDAAHAARLGRIDLDERDVDIDLSPLGEEQAGLLGRWFAGLPNGERPEVILTSPYVRAARTAQLIAAVGALTAPIIADERLREREFGVLDGLTGSGIRELHPDQASARRTLGKFYYRPPGGESWCDVILRLRGVMDTLSLHHAGARVLIVTHQVVVLCLRYLLENLDEAGILAIDRQGEVLNCAVTDYRPDPSAGRLALGRYNFLCAEPAPAD